MDNIQNNTNRYIFNFIIPLFIFFSIAYLILKSIFSINAFDFIFIVSVVLVALLSNISIYNFKWGIFTLLFLAFVINSLPVIILKRHIFYPIILFPFLGFTLGGIFRISRMKMDKFYKDIKFRVLSIFIILFTITATISIFFTILNSFNIFSLKDPGIHVYNVNVIGGNSISSVLFSLEMYLNYMITFILLFILVKRLKVSKLFLIKLFYTLFSANVVVFFVFLYQVFVDHSFGNQPNYLALNQINSTMIGPNTYAFLLVLSIGMFTAFLFYLDKRKHKILCMIMLFVLPFQILYSGSRTSLIGLAVFIALVISYFFISFLVDLIKKGKKNKNYILVMAAVLVLLVIIPSLFSLFEIKTDVLEDKDILEPAMLSRLSSNVEQVQEGASLRKLTSGRTIILPQAIKMIKDYPLAGAGIGVFPIELSNYLKLSGIDLKLVDFTLNIYLQILSENGIFSFIFFAGFYVTLFVIIFSNLKKISVARNKKFLIIIIFIIFSCLVMFNFIPGTNYYEGQLIYSFILILLLLLSYDFKKIGNEKTKKNQ
ncbi:MAG: O-antigen ligase family protein [Actinomycetota bacterium]|nr:O-antigen ligase family protein [Actinomycetota bacterium]